MSLPTLIPGYKATVTLNSVNFSAIGNVLALNRSKNIMTKPVFGSEAARSLGGQSSGTFEASGHVSAEQIVALTALFETEGPIAFSIQVGDATDATDAGVFAGSCSVGSYNLSAAADGQWSWSISATIDGVVTHTPAAP